MTDNDMNEPRPQGTCQTEMLAPRPIQQYIGLDLHKQDSQLCILDLEGTVTKEVRIRTSRPSLLAELGSAPRSRIVVEASTESEWVARALEELGHEVVVADPNFAPMYASRSRKIKTDKRDARALAQACRLGAFRRAHRRSDAQRHIKALLSTRESLIRSRTKQINLCRALLRQHGYRVASGMTESFGKRVLVLELTDSLKQQVGPLLTVMEVINKQVDGLDKHLEELGSQDEMARLLQSMPAVGPVTALAFRSVVDRAERFGHTKQLCCYLGLVPGEHSSGGDGTEHRRGSITKVGDGRVRWLLVQAAHNLLREPRAGATHLWMWGKKLESRRSRKIAVVALARRIAGILWAMMRDGKPYQACPLMSPQQEETQEQKAA